VSKGIRRTSPIRKAIPEHVATKVGQIITSYAYLDYRLKMLLWDLSGVDEKVGRITLRDPRATEKLQMARDLLFLKNIVVEDNKFKKLYDGINEVERLRDLLAHGIWTENDRKWAVISFKGNVEDQTISRTERKRQIRPESFNITPEGLLAVREAVEALISSVESFAQHATSSKMPSPNPPEANN
jgi:hypothetical protein